VNKKKPSLYFLWAVRCLRHSITPNMARVFAPLFSGSVGNHRELMMAATRWIMALKA
jgi:hypothetical protein